MTDPRTIATYDARAAEYAKMVVTGAPDAHLADFIAGVPVGGFVLDLGCGPATSSAHMRDAGLRVDPVDASVGMVTLANTTHDIGARVATFDDLSTVATYNGVWANFSLLHAPRDALPRHIAAIFTALKPGGVFHIGMKTGAGTSRDGIDRLYTFVSVAELRDLMENTGFSVVHTSEGVDKGLAGTQDPWVILRAIKD